MFGMINKNWSNRCILNIMLFSDKAAEDPPAKLLDDLFRKTKAAPCIYWLPLTEEQVRHEPVHNL